MLAGLDFRVYFLPELARASVTFLPAPEPHTHAVIATPSLLITDYSPLHTAGWWLVQDENSRTGWMPATYLQPIVDSGSATQVNVVGTDRKVIKSHTAQKDDELSIRVGEVVEVVRVSHEGWWFVT